MIGRTVDDMEESAEDKRARKLALQAGQEPAENEERGDYSCHATLKNGGVVEFDWLDTTLSEIKQDFSDPRGGVLIFEATPSPTRALLIRLDEVAVLKTREQSK